MRNILLRAAVVVAVLFGGSATLTQCPPPSNCTRTLNAGATISGNTGDTVCLHGGTYRQTVTISHSNWTLMAVPGETAIIDGSTLGLQPHDGLFNINAGVSGFHATDLIIQHSGGRGIQNDGNHNIFDHNLIQYTYNAAIMTTGYFGDASSNTYADNEINQAVQSNTAHNCNCWESAINNYGGVGPVGHNTYLRNYVHDSNGEGHTYVDYDTDTGSRYVNDRGGQHELGVYLDGAQHVTIDGVNTQGLMLADEAPPARTSNITVKNSTISLGLGLRFWNAGTSGTGLKNDLFDHNTITSGISFDSGNHSNTVVSNNHVTGPVSGLSQVGITSSGNTFG